MEACSYIPADSRLLKGVDWLVLLFGIWLFAALCANGRMPELPVISGTFFLGVCLGLGLAYLAMLIAKSALYYVVSVLHVLAQPGQDINLAKSIHNGAMAMIFSKRIWRIVPSH